MAHRNEEAIPVPAVLVLTFSCPKRTRRFAPPAACLEVSLPQWARVGTRSAASARMKAALLAKLGTLLSMVWIFEAGDTVRLSPVPPVSSVL